MERIHYLTRDRYVWRAKYVVLEEGIELRTDYKREVGGGVGAGGGGERLSPTEIVLRDFAPR